MADLSHTRFASSFSEDLKQVIEQALERVLVWIDRARQRRQLLALNDLELRDIGISRYDAIKEGDKPFWRV
jgi:uncharacterized protein YjiS (DUF1127 family)